MADYTWRDVTKTRRVYILPSPTNMTEFGKVSAAIMNDLNDRGIRYWDDTVTVEAHDEEIHLSFEIESPK